MVDLAAFWALAMVTVDNGRKPSNEQKKDNL